MRGPRAAAALAVIFLGLGGTAAAQDELSLSIGAGAFVPAGDLNRRVYGSGVVWAAELWLKFKGPFGLVAGLSGLNDAGTAAPLFDGDHEDYPVDLSRRTIPLALFYQLEIGGVSVRAGAGLAIHSFRETWRTEDFDYKGSGVGPRFLLAARVRLPARLSLMCSMAYDAVRAGSDSPNARPVELGGFQICGGLGFRIY